MRLVSSRLINQIDYRAGRLLGLLILLTAGVTAYVRFKVICLVHPDVGGIENNVIYSVLRLLGGYSLYEDPAAAPYSITQYGPVYYHIVAGTAKLFRLCAGDITGIYSLSRWVSLGANLLFLGGIAQLARQLRLPAHLIAGLVLLVFVWLPPQSYSRPDSLSNALIVWTIYSMTRWFADDRNWWRGALLTALLTALALFTKQSAVCLPLLVLGYGTVVAQDWRRVTLYGVALAIFLGINYCVWIREDFAVVWANVVSGISNGIDLANFKTNLIDHYLIPFSGLIVVSLAISCCYCSSDDGNRRVLGVAVIGLFFFACATGLKQGAALNYFTEFTALAVLLVVDAVRRWRNRRLTSPVWLNLALLVGAGLMVPANAANFNWKRVLCTSTELNLYQQDQAVARYLIDSLGLAPNDQVYNTLHNNNFLNALLFEHCILPQQEIVKDAAYPRRTFDYTRLETSVRTGQVRFIVTLADNKQLPLAVFRLTAYQPVKNIGKYTIYEANRHGRSRACGQSD